ncbi:MAG: hypothetical protein WC315_00555 [Candidatus Omnitrophota bacterium]|jgi:hypothetical protein
MSKSLQDKFLVFDDAGNLKDDGIYRAETILKEAGATIERGLIFAPCQWDFDRHTQGDMFDALDWLCDEWDYSFIPYEDF